MVLLSEYEQMQSANFVSGIMLCVDFDIVAEIDMQLHGADLKSWPCGSGDITVDISYCGRTIRNMFDYPRVGPDMFIVSIGI